MALNPATEVWKNGFVRAVTGDNSLGALVSTTTTTGAAFWGGYLRDPDGRLVVLYI